MAEKPPIPDNPRAARKKAKEWLQLGEKIYRYRRDILEDETRQRLLSATRELRRLRANKNTPVEELRASVERLRALMKLAGGYFYPRRMLAENAEMFLVAAILAIGIRTFFFQPFQIPTNSMYPSYNGLTWKTYAQVDNLPSGPAKLFRKLAFGATHKSLEAPADGELLIARKEPRLYTGRSWIIIPTRMAEYTFYVGRTSLRLAVPADFNFMKFLREQFPNLQPDRLPGLGEVLSTGVRFDAGETVLAFDILSGDALFVDRVTYHFRKPQIGEPFVFRTANIQGIADIEREKYYIKRLVGEGGDTLQVVPFEEPADAADGRTRGKLHRNGKPITGARAFELNHNREGAYEGYTDDGAPGFTQRHRQGGIAGVMSEPVTVPEGTFWAMGDNSDESADSRYFGGVPQKDVIGRAIFVYYPFTERWGPAH